MAKRIIAILLAVMTLFMFTASAAAPGVEAAAKKPKKIVLDQEGTIKLNKGEKFELTYTLKPEGAESKVTWKSSNTKVAKVSKKGVVTAKGEGKATITATTKNGKKDTVKIKVVDPYKPTNIEFKHNGTLTVNKGEKVTLSYQLTPENAKTQLTWKSSNKKIVSVNNDGTITAKKTGGAKITVITANGKKDTLKVKVVKKTENTPAPTSTPVPTSTPIPTATPAPTLKPVPTVKPTNTVTPVPTELPTEAPSTYDYVLNTNTKKFHKPTCRYVDDIHEENKEYFNGTRDELIGLEYTPCGVCKP